MQTKGIEMAGNIMGPKANIDCWNTDVKVCCMEVGMEIVAT
jgi:hypothetical protein